MPDGDDVLFDYCSDKVVTVLLGFFDDDDECRYTRIHQSHNRRELNYI